MSGPLIIKKIESVHDFIQWVFPLNEPSRANLSARFLSNVDIDAIRQSKTARGTSCIHLIGIWIFWSETLIGYVPMITITSVFKEWLSHWDYCTAITTLMIQKRGSKPCYSARKRSWIYRFEILGTSVKFEEKERWLLQVLKHVEEDDFGFFGQLNIRWRFPLKFVQISQRYSTKLIFWSQSMHYFFEILNW